MDPLLDALAVYRLWRLAAQDSILDQPRETLLRAAWDRSGRTRGEDPPPWPIELLDCPWCLGLWLASLAALSSRTRLWRAARYPLAVSAAAGLTALAVERLER